MTEQERREGFIRVIQEAERQFGMTITVTLQPEALGVVLQVRPTLMISPIPSWQPPDELPEPITVA